MDGGLRPLPLDVLLYLSDPGIAALMELSPLPPLGAMLPPGISPRKILCGEESANNSTTVKSDIKAWAWRV